MGIFSPVCSTYYVHLTDYKNGHLNSNDRQFCETSEMKEMIYAPVCLMKTEQEL